MRLDVNERKVNQIHIIYYIVKVELVKQSGRKWKDDSEVVSCTSCSQAFSLTNRKHHCRNCGDIFCKDCSSKQVPTLSLLIMIIIYMCGGSWSWSRSVKVHVPKFL